MKRLIIYFLIVLGSIWLGIKIYQHPGYVLIFYKNWAIESTVWVLGFLLILLSALIYFLIAVLRGTLHLPKRLRNWWEERRQLRAVGLLGKAHRNLMTGKWRQAEKKFLKSARNKNLAFMDYTFAAQAADAQYAINRRTKYLTKARYSGGENDAIVDVINARYLLQDNKPEEALTTLLKLRERYPRDPYLVDLLAQTYLNLGDWYHLQMLLRDIKRYKIYPEERYRRIEKQAYLLSLTDHVFPEYTGVQLLWNKMPNYLRHDADILIAYANQLNRWTQQQEAEKLIRKRLKSNFNSPLFQYYCRLPSSQPAKQMTLCEHYLEENDDDPAILQAMGMLCLRNQLWGQARDYLEASLKRNLSADTYSTLGYIYERLGENDRALRYYRKGLRHHLNSH